MPSRKRVAGVEAPSPPTAESPFGPDGETIHTLNARGLIAVRVLIAFYVIGASLIVGGAAWILFLQPLYERTLRA